MKIFIMQTVEQNEKPKTAWFSIIRRYNFANGYSYFIVLNSPFIHKGDYIDENTFEIKYGLYRNRHYLMIYRGKISKHCAKIPLEKTICKV
jgi:hypothetical protein